jgi:hypothetical protein
MKNKAVYWHNRNFITQHSDQVVMDATKKETFDNTDDWDLKTILMAGSWKIEDGFKSVVVIQNGKLKFMEDGKA